jgi:hypothetical protein
MTAEPRGRDTVRQCRGERVGAAIDTLGLNDDAAIAVLGHVSFEILDLIAQRGYRIEPRIGSARRRSLSHGLFAATLGRRRCGTWWGRASSRQGGTTQTCDKTTIHTALGSYSDSSHLNRRRLAKGLCPHRFDTIRSRPFGGVHVAVQIPSLDCTDSRQHRPLAKSHSPHKRALRPDLARTSWRLPCFKAPHT